MWTTREIYKTYNIMPNLQLHQLRVAAVGKLICDNFNQPVNRGDVILAGLFHDMGNILKFDLTLFPQFVEPEGVEYWESVKVEYLEKYGPDEHAATRAIAEEIGLPKTVFTILGNIGFSKMDQISASNSLELKIVEYGDSRVSAHGVTSIEERFTEGRERYMKMKQKRGVTSDQVRYDALIEVAHEIEQQIFSNTQISPEDINDASVAPIIEELWEYPIA